MSLKLYSFPREDAAISTDGTLPLSFVFDGRYGGAQDVAVYIRNDDLNKWYDGISVVAVDIAGGRLVDGTEGHSWKLSSSDKPLVQEEWDAFGPGNTLTFTSISIGSALLGDISTYLQFWIRVRIPENYRACNIDGVKLRLSATEHLVS